ncbi:MAG: metallophosphoesterase family protein [Vicinamibacteria bacterium]
MSTIAHISDLHFGAHCPEIVDGLVADLATLKPTLIAVSGDLTQRARAREFIAARAFLDRLEIPRLVVPGNHDIPLFDLLSRFGRPLARFRRYINQDVDPFFQSDGLAVLGINTARSNTWKEGRVSAAQVELIRRRFGSPTDRVIKVLVTHHPFLPTPGGDTSQIVGRAGDALRAAESTGVDVMLAGHLHMGYTGDVRTHHIGIRRGIVVAQAGTATSHRVRNEPNGYNLISLSAERLAFAVRVWDGQVFKEARVTHYTRVDGDWRQEEAVRSA